MDIVESTLWNSWLVVGQMAPYLLLGFLVAGVLSVCVSPAWVERHLGRPGWGSIIKASLFGVPLPLCSCGVIPVSASIYRHGASRGATTAFLLSTPQTGVDSIAITCALLGPVIAVFRPVAALVTGLVGGGLVKAFDQARPNGNSPGHAAARCQAECCSTAASGNVLLRILRYGFVTLPRDIGASLLLGVLIAGLIGAMVGEGQWHAYLGSGILSILLMMAVGVPLYVCATASVPIAAGFIHAGATPGAALAFLIAGPATNAASLTLVWKLLGRRTAAIFLLTVALSAIVSALLLDGLFPVLNIPAQALAAHDHSATAGGWMAHVWAIALVALMILTSKPLARLFRRSTPMENTSDQAAPGQQRITLIVGGMTCSHCADSVRRALAGCEGVSSAEVDLARGRAHVAGERLDPGQLISAVTALGYSARLSEEEGTP